MHDVLDPRDLVADELEQRASSGFHVEHLREHVAEAVLAGDLAQLARLSEELTRAERDAAWPYEEPEEDGVLLHLAHGAKRLDVPVDALPDRLYGAWLGRTVGNTLGKPIEGLHRQQVESYLRAADQWPLGGYLPLLDPLPPGIDVLHPSAPYASAGRFTDIPRDDDIDWTILALDVMERHGRGFTTEQMAAAWLDRIPFTQTYTAERAAYRNLVQGLHPPTTATTSNPYREWIGALIRADAFGFVCPGDPGEAAALALTDARLSHTANGKYGEIWAAALVAAALAVESAEEALHHASSVIPPRSRLAGALGGVAMLYGAGASRTEALDWVDQNLGHYPWVHTINNAALISIGLLWGESFLDAVGTTICGGRDTDSNAATVGSVYGAVHGSDAVPKALVGTTHVHVRSAVMGYDRVRVQDLAQRTLALATQHLPARS